jgi:hypothetical protein
MPVFPIKALRSFYLFLSSIAKSTIQVKDGILDILQLLQMILDPYHVILHSTSSVYLIGTIFLKYF